MNEAIRDRIAALLFSDAAQKIDFSLDKIRVTGSGLSFVALAMISNAPNAVKIAVGNLQANAAATYSPAQNTLRVPTANYGLQRFEKMTLIHECVHAMRDSNGSRLRVAGGFARPTALSDETAAIIAGALFDIFGHTDGITPSFADNTGPYGCAYSVALQMVSNPGADVAAVFDVGLQNLKEVIKKDPAYKHIRLNQPYGNDGIPL